MEINQQGTGKNNKEVNPVYKPTAELIVDHPGDFFELQDRTKNLLQTTADGFKVFVWITDSTTIVYCSNTNSENT